MSRRNLHISNTLSMPVEAVTRTFGILGQRGSGKTTAAVVMVEQIANAGARAVVVDPTGVWWGLRSSADGKDEGIPAVILGGEHGDMPLDETAGGLVADVVMNGDNPVFVLDLKLMRKGAQVRFLADFAEALYHSNREALTVVIDEADRFAPQTLREAGYAPRLLGALEDIVKLGRSRGLGCILITQRPATINKTVLEQVESLIVFRLVGPNDRKAIHAWVEAQGEPDSEAEVMSTIAKLDTGESWLWSPAFLKVLERVDWSMAETYDSRQTPEVGVKVRAPKRRSAIDLDVLREHMAELVEEAEANDPANLHKQIVELEKQLDAKPKPPEVIEVKVPDEAAMAELSNVATQIETQLKCVEEIVGDVGEVRRDFEGWLERVEHSLNGAAAIPPVEDQIASKVQPAGEGQTRTPAAGSDRLGGVRTVASSRAPGPKPSAPSTGELRKGARAMLTMAAGYPVPPTEAQLAGLCERSAKSSTWRNYRAVLTKAGYIELSARVVYITDVGRELAGQIGYDSVPNKPEFLQRLWMGVLRRGARDLLAHLIDKHPAPVQQARWAEAVGMSVTSSTFRNYRSVLTRLDLAFKTGDAMRASDWLVVGYH